MIFYFLVINLLKSLTKTQLEFLEFDNSDELNIVWCFIFIIKYTNGNISLFLHIFIHE